MKSLTSLTLFLFLTLKRIDKFEKTQLPLEWSKRSKFIAYPKIYLYSFESTVQIGLLRYKKLRCGKRNTEKYFLALHKRRMYDSSFKNRSTFNIDQIRDCWLRFYLEIFIVIIIIITANLRTNLNIISYINKLLCNDGRKWYFTIKTPVYKEINLARIRTMNAAKKGRGTQRIISVNNLHFP